jgi:hypothetical protein
MLRRHAPLGLRYVVAPALICISTSACDEVGPDEAFACDLDDEGCAAPSDAAEAAEQDPIVLDLDIGAGPSDAVAVTGNWRIVSLGCAFPDLANPETMEMKMFRDAIGKVDYPGVSHYFRSVSSNQFNLDGSVTIDEWKYLPNPRSYYDNKLDTLNAHCLAAHDYHVYFPEFKGINIVTNNGLGTSSGTVGTASISIDGKVQSYGVTWMNWDHHKFSKNLIHEIGHNLGMPDMFSSGNCQYGSVFDPMGDALNTTELTPGGFYPPYFSVANRYRLGWLDATRVETLTPGTTTVVNLERADLSTGKVMARVPIPGGETFTVEARKKAASGYEAALPRSGVAIMLVPAAADWVTTHIDADYDCNTTDQEAVWTPGETLTDPYRGLTISVLSLRSTGYKVSITTPVGLTVNPTQGRVILSVSGLADRPCEGPNCKYGIAPQSTVTLTAVQTDPNEPFAGWTGCPNPSGTTCTAVMSAYRSITANFADPDCYPSCFSDCIDGHTPSYCSSLCNNLCN